MLYSGSTIGAAVPIKDNLNTRSKAEAIMLQLVAIGIFREKHGTRFA
jgi:hypothetical protein